MSDIGVIDPAGLNQLRSVAATEAAILITGETGSGKTVLARHIHDISPRRDQPFVVVDCGALSSNLIESEMFGHVKGAFTGADRERVGKFAAAGEGTLVLDEISSLPLSLQTRLLSVLESREFTPLGSHQRIPFKARIIILSNVSLEPMVASGQFRIDLYERLKFLKVQVPPLRDRPEVIESLANEILASYPIASARRLSFAPSALAAMRSYSWPGNVRELRNVIDRAGTLAAGPVIQLEDLPESIQNSIETGVTSNPAPAESGPEIQRILDVLKKHKNNRKQAAAELGISRVSLYKKMHKYGLIDKTTSVDADSSPHEHEGDPAPPLSLLFEVGMFTPYEVTEVINAVGDLYRAMSGDELIIDSTDSYDPTTVPVPERSLR